MRLNSLQLTHRIDVKSSCSPQHPLLLHIYQLYRLYYDKIIDKHLEDELHHRYLLSITTQNIIQVIGTAKVLVLNPGTLQTVS